MVGLCFSFIECAAGIHSLYLLNRAAALHSSSLESQLSSLTASIEQQVQQQQQMRQQMTELEEADKALGRSGIQSFVLEGVLEELQAR